MVTGEDEHPSADQLIANVSGRAGIPRPGDACSLGKDVVSAIGDIAQLLDRFNPGCGAPLRTSWRCGAKH
jgi:hypothetical protein